MDGWNKGVHSTKDTEFPHEPRDVFSNFRAYRSEAVESMCVILGETFKAELLVRAKRGGFRVGEMSYQPPSRMPNPRIGGSVRAKARAAWALAKACALHCAL